tara:strand:+ start:164 stop:571 length:408 start_codon:yes stop_codon:yes gene_type:complete
MKKFIVLAVCLFFTISTTTNALSQTTEFQPFPVLTVKDSEEYVGILLSESEFSKIVELKIDYKFLKKTNGILQEELAVKNKNLEDTIKLFNNMTNKIKTEVKNESWVDKNKGMIGLITGFVVGAGLTILTVQAAK